MNDSYLEAYVEDHRDIFDFESATRLSAVMEAHYHGRIYLNKKRLSARGEVTSILGAITIGYLKFLFNMIKNFILYILQAIKFFVVDSGIIQGIVKGMMGLFGEDGATKLMKQKIKVVDPQDLHDECERICNIALKNTEHMNNYIINLLDAVKTKKLIRLFKKGRESVNDLDLLYSILPVDVSRGEENKFTVDFANKYAINQNDAKRYLADCQYRFKKYLDTINPQKLNLKATMELGHQIDAADRLVNYKKVLAVMCTEYYPIITKYLSNMERLSSIIQVALNERMANEKLYADNETQTEKDINALFYFYCDGLFAKVVMATDYMVKDVQTIRDTIIEQVAKISKAL